MSHNYSVTMTLTLDTSQLEKAEPMAEYLAEKILAIPDLRGWSPVRHVQIESYQEAGPIYTHDPRRNTWDRPKEHA
jgi:hypothetical protein